MLLSEVHSISILVKIGVFFKTNHLPALECGTEDNTFPAFYFGHNPERNTIRELCRLLSINIMARHSPEIFINPSPPPGPRMAGSRPHRPSWPAQTRGVTWGQLYLERLACAGLWLVRSPDTALWLVTPEPLMRGGQRGPRICHYPSPSDPERFSQVRTEEFMRREEKNVFQTIFVQFCDGVWVTDIRSGDLVSSPGVIHPNNVAKNSKF